MASPPIPPTLEYYAGRPFSFYPPILNIEHNEWVFVKATWSELLVANRTTGLEVWISRRYVGEVSRIDEPVLIVGLTRELEYKGGMVVSYQRRIIEMPVAVGGTASTVPGTDHAISPPAGIRLESSTDRRMLRLVGGTLVVAIVAYVFAMNLFRTGPLKQRITFSGKDQAYLELSGRDDFYAVVQKLGRPAMDRWQSDAGAIQVRALSYPERSYTVILMGSDRKSAQYIGTLDDHWRPIHSVDLRSGGTTAAMLRGLQRF